MSEQQLPAIYSDAGQEAVRAWWRDLDEDRGGRAQLRRAPDLLTVAFCPAYHDLRRRVSGRPEGLALVAGVLAQVRAEAPADTCLATLLGTPLKPGGSSPCSELRLHTLLRCDDPDELLRLARRVLGLVDHRADPGRLAADLHSWNQPWVKKTWAEDYYANAPVAK